MNLKLLFINEVIIQKYLMFNDIKNNEERLS